MLIYKNRKKGVKMGLFSKKADEKPQNVQNRSGIDIPLPPKSNNSSRFKDDFDHPFDINRPISEQTGENLGGTSVLMPTTLTPQNSIDLGLPKFSTESNHEINLDEMEKELLIGKSKDKSDEKKQTIEQSTTEETLIPDSFGENDQIETNIELKHQETSSYDDIPDEIEDIPDFIPELDIEEEMLSTTIGPIEEPKEKRAAFIGINSIINIKKNSDDIKLRIDSILDNSQTINDEGKKEKELLAKAKNIFEDVERKILFINKVLFVEE